LKKLLFKLRGFVISLLKAIIRRGKRAYFDYQQLRLFRRQDRMPNQMTAQAQFPQLSAEQKAEIDAYWKRFGIRISNYRWHQLYYGATGREDPRFLPHSLLASAVYPYYNDMEKAKVWADKNEFSRVLPNLSFPVTLAQKIHGRYYDAQRRSFGTALSRDFAEAVWESASARGLDAVILKRTSNTNSGRGVKKLPLTTVEALAEALSSSDDQDYIIQEPIRQHPFFAQFNESSVNILRINTWRSGEKFRVFAPCVRFGTPGFATDVAFIKGKEVFHVIAVRPDGRIDDCGYDLYGEKSPVIVQDRQVPCWEELLETVRKNHLMLDYFDFVAWDLTVDAEGKIVCIEYNLQEPGSIAYQYAHGPFAGDDTEELLAFLLEKKNRERLLPRRARLRT
jgi:hypothetical protein